MKKWFKWGLIASGIFIILVILSWIISFLFPTGEPLSYYGIFIFYPCILFFSGESGMACTVLGPLMNLIIVFIIGAVIGKIKQ